MACRCWLGFSNNYFRNFIMRLLTVRHTAAKCGVSVRQIYRWASDADYDFPDMKKPYGRRGYFIEEEINQWLADAIEKSDNAKSS